MERIITTPNQEANNTATQEILLFLQKEPQTKCLFDVRNCPQYKSFKIHLLWQSLSDEELTSIKVIGDRYYYTGNFFLETTKENTIGYLVRIEDVLKEVKSTKVVRL